MLKEESTIIINKKRDKYFDFARDHPHLRTTLWNIMIQIIISALETIPKNLVRRLEELEIEGRAEITQTTALLMSARIL